MTPANLRNISRSQYGAPKSGVDSYGRKIVTYQGKEVCNNYNRNQYSHPQCQLSHVCSLCFKGHPKVQHRDGDQAPNNKTKDPYSADEAVQRPGTRGTTTSMPDTSLLGRDHVLNAVVDELWDSALAPATRDAYNLGFTCFRRFAIMYLIPENFVCYPLLMKILLFIL